MTTNEQKTFNSEPFTTAELYYKTYDDCTRLSLIYVV